MTRNDKKIVTVHTKMEFRNINRKSRIFCFVFIIEVNESKDEGTKPRLTRTHTLKIRFTLKER